MPAIPPECRPLQEELEGIQAEIRGLQEELSTAPPAQKPVIIQMIADARERERAVSRRLDNCIAGARSYLDIAGVEYTQAIQFFDFNGQGSGSAPANSIPLVAQKSLIIRVYVARHLHGSPFPTSVSGTLRYRRVGGQTFPDLSPISAPIVARASGDIDRGNADHTLNFRIAAEHCVGTLSFQLTFFDPAVPGFESTRTLNPVRFRVVPLLRIHGVLIRYTGQGLNLPAPTGQDLVDEFTYLGRTYPISGIQYTGCDEVQFAGNLMSGGGGCGDGWTDLLNMLENMRSASGTDDLFIGLLPSGVPSNQFNGCGRGGVAASKLGSGTRMAHEVGHALGRRHAPCGNPKNVDSNYPDYDAYPSASIGEFGVNAVNLSIQDPASTFDYMSYCGPRWTSPYTYVGLMNRIAADLAVRHRDIAEVQDEMRERLYLNFRVYREGTIELFPSYHLLGPTHVREYGRPVDITCELLGPEGQVLESYRCHHTDPHQDPYDRYLDFHEVINWHPETHSIAVRRDGELLETVELPPDVPTVTVVGQPKAARGRPDVVRIEWEAGGAAQANAAPTSYMLRYSNDGGETWRAVAADLTVTSHTINTKLLPGGERCLFQVVASSGIRTATAETEPRRVEKKPREGFVLSPESGANFREGDPVILRGGGFSPDAETTEFDEISWSSNRDGALGTGYELILQTLSAGKHRITMSFPDGLGDQGSASVWIDVESSG